MKLDECFCTYHLCQQQKNLSEKMQGLGVTGSTSNTNAFNENKLNTNNRYDTNLQNGGTKRHFSTINDNEDEEMSSDICTHTQERKRIKANITKEEEMSREASTSMQEALEVKEQKNEVCMRCMNGEPGHISHLSQQHVEYMEE